MSTLFNTDDNIFFWSVVPWQSLMAATKPTRSAPIFGRTLRELRGEATFGEVANRLAHVGVKTDRSYVLRWEGGRVPPPDVIWAYETAYRLSPGALLKQLAEELLSPETGRTANGSKSGHATHWVLSEIPNRHQMVLDRPDELDRIRAPQFTHVTEGPMRDQIDTIVHALGTIDEDKRPAFVDRIKKIAAAMVLGIDEEDTGRAPVKRRHTSGKG